MVSSSEKLSQSSSLSRPELKNAWIKSKTKLCKDGDPLLRERFTSYQKVLRATIKQAKKSFTHRRFSDCKEDRKKTWNIINELRGKNKQKLKPLFTINNKKVTNRRVIANKFNSYFISIASNLNSSIITPRRGRSTHIHSYLRANSTIETLFSLPSITQ